MSDFRCVPLAASVADRFRARGVDDGGNPLLRREPGPDSRCPCRQCLQFSVPGQTVLLGSFHLAAPAGVYWSASPIFLHEAPCHPYDLMNDIPPIVRDSLVSIRAYDQDDMCLYDLGHVGNGDTILDRLRGVLDDPRSAYVNIHTAKPGCLLCRVERC